MCDLKNLNYGIVGLGIMGGSIAKSIRNNVLSEGGATGKIFASNRSRPSLQQAIREGFIDEAFDLDAVEEMLSKCDVVYVCLYPKKTAEFIISHNKAFKSGCVITDISGVKTGIVDKIAEAIRTDIDFVSGHPMAGGEKEGYAHSNDKFFVGRNYIVMPTPQNKPENVELIKTLAAAMGFSRIVETDYKNHDHKIAFTSQLCHVIASALVESAEDERVTEFGGGSFEDLTRIAMINAPLWTELFLLDRKELVSHIDNFMVEMERFKNLLETHNDEALVKLLQDVRERRIKMGAVRSVSTR